MSDLDGFVRALNDAPADLALYGVFADWLEEKGGKVLGWGVTYGPDFAYALRWCRGRKQRPLLLPHRQRFPWRWLRAGRADQPPQPLCHARLRPGRAGGAAGGAGEGGVDAGTGRAPAAPDGGRDDGRG